MNYLNKISKCFFINLDRRVDRLLHMKESLTFSAERFTAVDSEQTQVSEEVMRLFPKTFKERSRAEICCAISHYRLWKKLVRDKDSKNFLIMEDDTCFNFKKFDKVWNEIFSKKMPLDYSLIFLGGCQPWNKPHYREVLEPYNSFYNRIKENNYFSEGDNFWHMSANSYIVSKQAASLMCQWVDQNGMDCGVDHFMIKFFNKNKIFKAPNSIYHLNPLATYQLHEEGDNMEIDKKSDLRFAKDTFDDLDESNLRAEDLLIPKKTNLTKFRCGKNKDGGYVLLREIFDEIDTVYSYGIDDSEDSESFDIECANAGKRVFMYDGTINREQSSSSLLFFKKENLTNENFELHIEENGDGDKEDMLLKMDIEGCEYPVIESNIDLVEKHFKMICIELHGLNNPEYYNFENKLEVISLLLERYDIFHMHANNWVERKFKVPNVLEVSLVRKGVCSLELDRAYPIEGLDFPNCEGRDDYILDWWTTKKKEDHKRIFYWKYLDGKGNFGDELNIPVGRFLFGEDASFTQECGENSIYLIGSNLANVKCGDLACGAGLHSHNEEVELEGVEFNCVRGPLSLKNLNKRRSEPIDCFLGDPALLLKLFYKPELNRSLAGRVGVVAHISSIDYFKQQVDSFEGFYFIDPTNCWEQVVSEIYSCRSVISNSLHGLICADAYDKPNVWIKVPGRSIPPCGSDNDYGDFKYWDYLLSQGRKVEFISDIRNDLSKKNYTGGNKIDLREMFFSISGKKFIEEGSFPGIQSTSSSQIPKKIHLCWKNKNLLDLNFKLVERGVKNLELLNSDWDIEVSDDEDINRFLRNSVGRDNWSLIKDKKITEKTDLWRLIKTYKQGGMYIDIDRYIDTPISEIINPKTSMVLPTFQDIDFSQDFILTCAKNPIIGRAIVNNLKYRKQGETLFFVAVQSYMHSVSEVLTGDKVDRGNNKEYLEEVRRRMRECEYTETYREEGPGNHVLYRDVSDTFDIDIFERDKADFYNEENVIHWNSDTQRKHESIELKSTAVGDEGRKLAVGQFKKMKDRWGALVNDDSLKFISDQLESPQLNNKSFDCYYPGGKIAIISLYTDDIAEFAHYSEANIKQYCKKHDYTFYIYRDKIEGSSSPNWSKAGAILNHIDDHEYIVWIDSDALVFNKNKKIEDIIHKCSNNKYIIACEDIGKKSMLNSGVLIFKSASYTKNLIIKWRDFNGDKSFLYASGGDQEVLCSILKAGDGFGFNRKVFPMNEFNTDPRMIDDDTFIIHFMAYPYHLKKIFIRYFVSKTICNSVLT